jgi:hypothetical protein
MYVSIWIFLYRLHVIFVFVFIVNFDNVTIGVISRRVALQNISVVAGVLDALRESVDWPAQRLCKWDQTFL